jgi:predicted phosphodiesterase
MIKSFTNIKIYSRYREGDSCPYRGCTNLQCAVIFGDIETVKLLMAAERRWRLRANDTSTISGRTYKESLQGCMATSLSKNGDGDNHGGLLMAGYNAEGRSAVAIALVHGHWDMVKLLAEHAECDLYRSDHLHSNALAWLGNINIYCT